jgi:hypothetical protein
LNPTTANPSFIPDRNGTYQILLTVQAGLEPATDTVVVVTQNHPPVDNAGADSGAQIGKKFTLVGVGTDPDLDKLTFAWTLLSRPDSRPGRLQHAEEGRNHTHAGPSRHVRGGIPGDGSVWPVRDRHG